jgi:iron complex outermembrane receptor protein
MIANLSGKVEGPLVTHNLVFGAELGWFTSDEFLATQTSPANPATPLPIDGSDPVYGLVPPNPPPAYAFDSSFWRADYGLYFQDLINVGEHWKVLAGVRYDHCDTAFDRSFEPLFGPTTTDQSFDEGSPRVGVVYEPIPDKLSYYAMYAESFTPPDGGPRETTAPLQPELGQTWEGGIKMKPLSGVTLTAAGFYIVRENVTADLFDPVTYLVVTEQLGKQRSQGAELDAIGQITARWSVLANYAYTDTLVTDPANPAIDGQRALGVPFNTASVWTRYNMVQNERRTFGVGLGVIRVGQRLGDYTTPAFYLPEYTRWDAGVYYRQGRFDASCYFENIFDTTYYTGSVSQYEVFPGAPFNFRTQVSYRF